MPHKSFEVQVKPVVMRWARESAGRSIRDVATRLGVDEGLVASLEEGRKKPTITQLRTLARYYRRSLDVFLLSEPPNEPPLPHDFRVLPNERDLPFHSETRFALRKARRLQSIVSELKGPFHEDLFYKLGKIDIFTDTEFLANEIRSLIGIDLQTQIKWKNVDALNKWIRLVENLNVIVTQISMPIEDARAFSLKRDGYPIIVLNRTDSRNGKVFSLFHEVGHVLLNEEGICDPSIHSPKRFPVEEFCNHFAGAFLVPKKDLLDHYIVKKQNINEEWLEHTLHMLANDFKVSKEVILRRLLIFKCTSQEFYDTKRKEWAIRDKQIQEEKIKKLKERKSGRQNIARECIQQNGASIVSLVLESYYDDKLSKYDIANYLEVNLKHLSAIEKTLRSQA